MATSKQRKNNKVTLIICDSNLYTEMVYQALKLFDIKNIEQASSCIMETYENENQTEEQEVYETEDKTTDEQEDYETEKKTTIESLDIDCEIPQNKIGRIIFLGLENHDSDNREIIFESLGKKYRKKEIIFLVSDIYSIPKNDRMIVEKEQKDNKDKFYFRINKERAYLLSLYIEDTFENLVTFLQLAE